MPLRTPCLHPGDRTTLAIPTATRKGERHSILQWLTAHPGPAINTVKTARFPTAPKCAHTGRSRYQQQRAHPGELRSRKSSREPPLGDVSDDHRVLVAIWRISGSIPVFRSVLQEDWRGIQCGLTAGTWRANLEVRTQLVGDDVSRSGEAARCP